MFNFPVSEALGFDFETGAYPKAVLDEMLPPFSEEGVKYGNAKDPKLRAEILEKAREKHVTDFYEDAALNPLRSSIVAVGTKLVSETTPSLVYVKDVEQAPFDLERALLKGTWDRMNEAKASRIPIYGLNIQTFDLPFFIKRSWMLEVEVPSWVYTIRGKRIYFDDSFVDLRFLWLMNGDEFREPSSEDYLCKLFGLPTKPFQGKEFATRLRAAKTPEELQYVLGYLQGDLTNPELIAKRLQIIASG